MHQKLRSLTESRLRKKYLAEVFETLAMCVKSELAGATTLNLMFDGWSDKYNGAHYLGFRIQYIADDFTARVLTISVKRCAQDADSIYSHIRHQLDEFVPNHMEKILYSTHDGASTMMKVSKLLKVTDCQHCVAHATQWAVVEELSCLIFRI